MDRLRELGWIERRTVAIDYRWDEGRLERQAEVAGEFVRLKVDVIVTVGSAVPAAKRETAVIPIVFALSIDPVGGGLVKSLSRPGGNVTGLSIQSTDVAGKRIELLREVVPQLHRVAIIADGGFAQSQLEMRQAEAAARTLGLNVAPLEIRMAENILPKLATLSAPSDALYVASDALVNANRDLIIKYALAARLPTIFSTRDHVKAGALMSYGETFQIFFDVLQIWSIRSCEGQSRQIFR